MIQRIVRMAEVCSKCGAVEKFSKRSTVHIRGQKRVYLVCSACGAHAVRVYVTPRKGEKSGNLPKR